jgi:hypothetical protein
MRITFPTPFTFAAMCVLGGCAGGGLTASGPSLPPSGLSQTQASSFDDLMYPLRVAPQFAVSSQAPSRQSAIHSAKVGDNLFVSEASAVTVLENKTYKNLGTIRKGVINPRGLWADKARNLYVTNVNRNVVEYAPGTRSPSCTYSASLIDPFNVTADSAGNVYVSNYTYDSMSYVNKYAQCSNTLVKQYSVPGVPHGVAVDDDGNIFVSTAVMSTGVFVEFKKGNDRPTKLGVTTGSPGGMVLDRNHNLIVDDLTGGSIDVIAPPYTSATPLVTGLSNPYHISLDKSEKLLFNANYGTSSVGPTVTVYDYPSGTLVTTLGSANGITASYGVSDSPDANF